MAKQLNTRKPLIANMVANIDKLTPGELILLSEEIDRNLKPLEDAKEALKQRLKAVIGEQESMNIMVPSSEDPNVQFPFRIYKQYRKRFEPMTMDFAENLIKDGDILDVICEPRTVEFTRAKEALPKELFEELNGKRTEMEPITMIKIGMAKR